jgi:hypothetical protein
MQPFTVCCVLEAMEDVNAYEEVVAVRDFCEKNRIRCTCRPFDSSRYEEDAVFITKLPAFFVYTKSRVTRTAFYADDNPLRILREEIVRVRCKQEEAEQRRQVREGRWKAFLRIFGRSDKIATHK